MADTRPLRVISATYIFFPLEMILKKSTAATTDSHYVFSDTSDTVTHQQLSLRVPISLFKNLYVQL